MRLETFILLLASSVLLSQCVENHNNKEEGKNGAEIQLHGIEYILSQDDSLGKVRNHAPENISLNKSIEQYVTLLRKLDYENCPQEFSQAFSKHLDAWDEMGNYVRHYRELRGEMHVLFDSIQTIDNGSFDSLLKNIWSTWAKVESTHDSIVKKALIKTPSDCMACERIHRFKKSKKLVAESIWPGLNAPSKNPVLLYFTDSLSYVAFDNNDLNAFQSYQKIFCAGRLIIRRSDRMDEQAFHMENKMSFTDTTSIFYYNPMMLCSDVETMTRFVPDFTTTEEWLLLVMHEYFHSFQFMHASSIDYLAKEIKMGADTLDRIYTANEWFQTALKLENKYLINAIQSTHRDSLIWHIDKFYAEREQRRKQYKEQTGFDVSKIESFWETIEGTARYSEYYLAGYFSNFSTGNFLTCDSHFQNFDAWKNKEELENKKEMKERTKIMTAYYYATGFNLCRLLDKLNIEYKTEKFQHPEIGLDDILRNNS